MKFILNLFVGTLASIGAITLIDLGFEKFSKEAEKPTSYVYLSEIRKANELCENSGGPLRLGNVYIKGGKKHHLMCTNGQEIIF